MPIQSPSPFLSAYLNHSTCELYAGIAPGTIIAYVPTLENWEAQITFDAATFVQANQVAMSMGLEPVWG